MTIFHVDRSARLPQLLLVEQMMREGFEARKRAQPQQGTANVSVRLFGVEPLRLLFNF